MGNLLFLEMLTPQGGVLHIVGYYLCYYYYYYYYYYHHYYYVSHHKCFLPDTSPLETTAIPTTQASSYGLHYFPY